MIILPNRLLGRIKPIVPGSQTWSTPGTYQLIIPDHHSVTMDVRGGAGGGAGAQGYNGSWNAGSSGAAGANSQVTRPGGTFAIGYGGGAAIGAAAQSANGTNGSAGSAYSYDGTGGTVGGGATGGQRGIVGNSEGTPTYYGAVGGNGGRVLITIDRGFIVPGTVLTIVVGSGGGAGANGASNWPVLQTPTAGGNGAVSISWN